VGVNPTSYSNTMKTQTKWNKHLMSTYRQMKAKNKNVKLSDAMKVAKRSYRG
jgi:hypothetical protein